MSNIGRTITNFATFSKLKPSDIDVNVLIDIRLALISEYRK